MKLIKKISLFVGISASVVIVFVAVYYGCIMIKYGMAVREDIEYGRETATMIFKEISFEGIINEIDDKGKQITVCLVRIDSVPKKAIPLTYASPFWIYNDTLYIRYKSGIANKLKKGVSISKKSNTDYLSISGDSISVYEIMDF